jgi:MoxR-like ATPase
VTNASSPAEQDLLLRALSWVDLLIFAEVQRVRMRGRALSKDSPWGAYIGETEVDEILGDLLDIGPLRLDETVSGELRTLIESRGTEVRAALAADLSTLASGGDATTLARLVKAFELNDADLGLLLLALAPEVNARYLRLFAYLQDDFSATYLCPALAARVLSDDRAERLRLGGRFAPDSPLCRYGIVELAEGGSSGTPQPARPMVVSPRIVRWLLHAEGSDSALDPWVSLELHPGDSGQARKPVAAAVEALLGALSAGEENPVVQFKARSRRDSLEASRHLAMRSEAPLMVADLEMAGRLGIYPAQCSGALVREARLLGAVLLLTGVPTSSQDEAPFAPLLVATRDLRLPVLIDGGTASGSDFAGERRWLSLDLPGLSFSERERAWKDVLKGLRKAAGGGKKASTRYKALDPAKLARRYRFSPGQIAQVLDSAANRATSRGQSVAEAEDVLLACSTTFVPAPGPLAENVPVRRSWADLIVPADTRVLLEEIVAQVERREEVLEAISEARVRAGERGVKVLFSGPPGTGKTLAAEVLAAALGYPLLRVDLASVVSKWVGETEKLLSRLFESAEDAPCVLLFDEADALFGSRSEVKGAQDRFANLEVSYLLQRLESFEGVAVLTTNLKRNIDEAFLRRFTAVVDFPFPEAAERFRIWERVLPGTYPLAADVSLPAVATEFKLSGANIWNVAVAAGVLAAGSSARQITRSMLAHAVKREYQKLGRQVASLRPQLLSTDAEPGPSDPKKKSRRRKPKALSAAEARRRHLVDPKDVDGDTAATPGPADQQHAKPSA